MHALTMKGSSPCQVLSWHISEGDGGEAGQTYIASKILLGPRGPDCHMAAPSCGSTHHWTGASCSGKGWKGGKEKYFTIRAVPGSIDSSGFEYFKQKAVQKTSRGKASTAMAENQEPNMDVLDQL